MRRLKRARTEDYYYIVEPDVSDVSEESRLRQIINEQAQRITQLESEVSDVSEVSDAFDVSTLKQKISEQAQRIAQLESEVHDVSTLKQIISEQAQRITRLEEIVRTFESVKPSDQPQGKFECSICRKEIKEKEPVWVDSEFYVFHSPHIKEWIRTHATHPITKVKMPQELELYEPNVVLIDGKLKNLEEAKKLGLI